MDFFQSRYFGAALGRFTSPDDPFAGQDASDPQSWNLYSYVLNNPLRYTDPDGHDDEDNSNGVPTFRATGTGYSGLSLLDELLYRSFMNSLNTALQQTQQVAQQGLDWLTAPRDPGCMQKAAVLGAGAGAVIGGAAGGFGGGAVGGVAGSIVPFAGTAAGREFPSQYLNKTLVEIRAEAQAGSNPAARKALKLLTDNRFNK